MSSQFQQGRPHIRKKPGPQPRLLRPKAISGQLEETKLAEMDEACKTLGVSRCDFLRLAVDAYLESLQEEEPDKQWSVLLPPDTVPYPGG